MPENYKSISILKKILKINSQEQNINTNGLILPSEKMESIKKNLEIIFSETDIPASDNRSPSNSTSGLRIFSSLELALPPP